MNPAMSFSRFALQVENYVAVTLDEVGPLYLKAAAIPIFLLRSVCAKIRTWLLGSLLAWFVMAMVTLIGLNADNYNI